jgi:hypothetical protein
MTARRVTRLAWLPAVLAMVVGLAGGVAAPASAATTAWLGAQMTNDGLGHGDSTGNVFISYDGTWITGGVENTNPAETVDVHVYVVQCRPNEHYPCGGLVTYNDPAHNGITTVTGHTFVTTVGFRAQGGHKYYAGGWIASHPYTSVGAIYCEGVTLDALPHAAAGRWICVGGTGNGFTC